MASNSYNVPPAFLKKYSPKEIHDLKRAFKEFDTNSDGFIEESELSSILRNLDEDPSEATNLISSIDRNQDGRIEFSEFLSLLHSLRTEKTKSSPVINRSSSSSSSSDTTTTPYGARKPSLSGVVAKHLTLHEVKGSTRGVHHSYSDDEKNAFTEHINNVLSSDKDLSNILPTSDLFTSVSDGILLCKLINKAVPDTIDTRALNFVKKGKTSLNVYQQTENQNLCINAAKSIGCTVVNIHAEDLIHSKPILILGLVWQIVKIQLTCDINLKSHPELVILLKEGETLQEFMTLAPDVILLRWMNYHLEKSDDYDKIVTNFGKDVADARAYDALLHQVAPKGLLCKTTPSISDTERASVVISNASKRLDIETFIKPSDITSGNTKLNMSFVAQVFNTHPALEVVEEQLVLELKEEIQDDDIGDTREERVFRMWINSLALDDGSIYINNLFSDLSDGIIILKLMDYDGEEASSPTHSSVVNWKKVNLNPKNKFKKVENCNYCVTIGKESLKFSLVNVGGVDIVGRNKKLILALIWQLMRYHQLKMLSSLGGNGGVIADADIIEWANKKVQSAFGMGSTPARQMMAFRELSLADGLFLIDLVASIEPRAVDYDQVLNGSSVQDKTSNAKYLLSVARKIGATVFLTYEDILEVKPKMIMTFVATLMYVDKKRSHTLSSPTNTKEDEE